MSLIELRKLCEVGFQIEHMRKSWREGEWKVRTKTLNTLPVRQLTSKFSNSHHQRGHKGTQRKKGEAKYFQWMLPVAFLSKPDHQKKFVCMLACFIAAFLGPWLGVDE